MVAEKNWLFGSDLIWSDDLNDERLGLTPKPASGWGSFGADWDALENGYAESSDFYPIFEYMPYLRELLYATAERLTVLPNAALTTSFIHNLINSIINQNGVTVLTSNDFKNIPYLIQTGINSLVDSKVFIKPGHFSDERFPRWSYSGTWYWGGNKVLDFNSETDIYDKGIILPTFRNLFMFQNWNDVAQFLPYPIKIYNFTSPDADDFTNSSSYEIYSYTDSPNTQWNQTVRSTTYQHVPPSWLIQCRDILNLFTQTLTQRTARTKTEFPKKLASGLASDSLDGTRIIFRNNACLESLSYGDLFETKYTPIKNYPYYEPINSYRPYDTYKGVIIQKPMENFGLFANPLRLTPTFKSLNSRYAVNPISACLGDIVVVDNTIKNINEKNGLLRLYSRGVQTNIDRYQVPSKYRNLMFYKNTAYTHYPYPNLDTGQYVPNSGFSQIAVFVGGTTDEFESYVIERLLYYFNYNRQRCVYFKHIVDPATEIVPYADLKATAYSLVPYEGIYADNIALDLIGSIPSAGGLAYLQNFGWTLKKHTDRQVDLIPYAPSENIDYRKYAHWSYNYSTVTQPNKFTFLRDDISSTTILTAYKTSQDHPIDLLGVSVDITRGLTAGFGRDYTTEITEFAGLNERDLDYFIVGTDNNGDAVAHKIIENKAVKGRDQDLYKPVLSDELYFSEDYLPANYTEVVHGFVLPAVFEAYDYVRTKLEGYSNKKREYQRKYIRKTVEIDKTWGGVPTNIYSGSQSEYNYIQNNRDYILDGYHTRSVADLNNLCSDDKTFVEVDEHYSYIRTILTAAEWNQSYSAFDRNASRTYYKSRFLQSDLESSEIVESYHAKYPTTDPGVVPPHGIYYLRNKTNFYLLDYDAVLYQSQYKYKTNALYKITEPQFYKVEKKGSVSIDRYVFKPVQFLSVRTPGFNIKRKIKCYTRSYPFAKYDVNMEYYDYGYNSIVPGQGFGYNSWYHTLNKVTFQPRISVPGVPGDESYNLSKNRTNNFLGHPTHERWFKISAEEFAGEYYSKTVVDGFDKPDPEDIYLSTYNSFGTSYYSYLNYKYTNINYTKTETFGITKEDVWRQFTTYGLDGYYFDDGFIIEDFAIEGGFRFVE